MRNVRNHIWFRASLIDITKINLDSNLETMRISRISLDVGVVPNVAVQTSLMLLDSICEVNQ